jgi:type IV pilus assembly protein PilX
MNARKQSGMALFISLILLLLLTVIAITAAHQSALQSRMAANSQQQNIAFQTAESGIQAWIAEYEDTLQIAPISVSGQLTDTTPYTASAPAPGNCWDVVPAYSLNAAEGGTTFQFACFNIDSSSKACADNTCSDDDNPAQARHFQGHLVRY